MKTKDLLAIICILIFTMVGAMAQLGTNFGNPCLNVKKGPNTLKTKKHVVRGTHTRFNSHRRANGNGNINAVIINSDTHKKPIHHIKKNRIHRPAKKAKIHQRKPHRHSDRGDK